MQALKRFEMGNFGIHKVKHQGGPWGMRVEGLQVRDVEGVLGGMSLEGADPFWIHMSACKLQKSLKWAVLGIIVQQ